MDSSPCTTPAVALTPPATTATGAWSKRQFGRRAMPRRIVSAQPHLPASLAAARNDNAQACGAGGQISRDCVTGMNVSGPMSSLSQCAPGDLPPTTLIICSRNRPQLLQEAVESVLRGREVPTELLIIDQSQAAHPALANL